MGKIAITLVGIAILAACATQRPALYPNEQFKRGGAAAANRDIDDCMRQAKQYVSSDGRVGSEAAGMVAESGTNAAVGAAAGAAGGAIVGRAGSGAAIGAASAGAAGITRGLIHGVTSKSAPPPAFQNFVNRCLREKGYDPIGWG